MAFDLVQDRGRQPARILVSFSGETRWDIGALSEEDYEALVNKVKAKAIGPDGKLKGGFHNIDFQGSRYRLRLAGETADPSDFTAVIRSVIDLRVAAVVAMIAIVYFVAID